MYQKSTDFTDQQTSIQNFCLLLLIAEYKRIKTKLPLLILTKLSLEQNMSEELLT